MGRAIEGLPVFSSWPPGPRSQFPIRFTSIEDLIARTGLRRDELRDAGRGRCASIRSATTAAVRSGRSSARSGRQGNCSSRDRRSTVGGQQPVVNQWGRSSNPGIPNPESPLPFHDASRAPRRRLCRHRPDGRTASDGVSAGRAGPSVVCSGRSICHERATGGACGSPAR